MFKVFVANPNKPPAVVDILSGNCDRLLKYLHDFHSDKGARAHARAHARGAACVRVRECE